MNASSNRQSSRAARGGWRRLLWLLAAPGFLVATGLAQTPPFEWVRAAGGTSSDQAYAVAVDANTNIYVTGSFAGTAYFGGTNLTTISSADIFVAKFDSAGIPVWVRQGGASDFSAGKSIAVDPSGNVYVTGSFRGTVNFGGGSLTSVNSSSDVFIVKYSSSGALVWAKRGGAEGGDIGYGIVLDAQGPFSRGNRSCRLRGFEDSRR